MASNGCFLSVDGEKLKVNRTTHEHGTTRFKIKDQHSAPPLPKDLPTLYDFGEVIKVKRNFVEHYGVYIGVQYYKGVWQDTVIHFWGTTDSGLKALRFQGPIAWIQFSSTAEFANGGIIETVHTVKDNKDLILERALSVLNRAGYNLFSCNCEHAARWIVGGDNFSSQVSIFSKYR